jgi:hypothetical protein
MKAKLIALKLLTITMALVCISAMTVTSVRATTLPPGTQILVRINDKLDSSVARSGQSFTGTVTQAVVVNGRTVIPAGARASGQISQAISSGRLKKPASITLELRQAGGRTISTAIVSIDGKSHLVRNAEFIGGGTAAGAIIGAIVGGSKGAAIGAATGAGAGTAGAFLTGKKEIVIPAETTLPFVVPGGNESPYNTTANRREANPQPPVDQNYPPPPPPPPNYPPPPREGYPGDYRGQPYFSDGDQRLVRRYYSSNTSNLPPGLAKRGGNLPPGLERQVERNGTLPPGLQKRVEPFPSDLDRQMPRLPSGFLRVFLGNRALIIDRNNRVLDVMDIGQGEDDEGRGHGNGRGHGHGRGRDDDDHDRD